MVIASASFVSLQLHITMRQSPKDLHNMIQMGPGVGSHRDHKIILLYHFKYEIIIKYSYLEVYGLHAFIHSILKSVLDT